jgi:hypothetical protein
VGKALSIFHFNKIIYQVQGELEIDFTYFSRWKSNLSDAIIKLYYLFSIILFFVLEFIRTRRYHLFGYFFVYSYISEGREILEIPKRIA